MRSKKLLEIADHCSIIEWYRGFASAVLLQFVSVQTRRADPRRLQDDALCDVIGL